MASGDTKTEQYLDIAANGSRADFSSSCCETRTQTLIREVGERVMDVEDEVEEMKNNPDVADIVATYADLQAYDTQHLTDKDIIRVLTDETHDGESTYYRYDKHTDTFTYVGTSKQYSNFTGTDGTAAGTAGLVPAPATTDAGKFLKADGNWSEISGGSGVVQLTPADYNYPTDNPNGVALWRLSPGLYNWDNGVRVYVSAYSSNSNGASALVTEAAGNAREYVEVLKFSPGGGATATYTWSKVNYNTGAVVSNVDNARLLTDRNVVQTTGTSSTNVMSQKAVTGMIYASGYDPSTGSSDGNRVAIGGRSTAGARTTIAIGAGRLDTSALAIDSVALGEAAAVGNASYRGSVALGSYAVCTAQGQVQIGSTQTSDGYNSSNYRLLSGLYDPQSDHDAATKGYVDAVAPVITMQTTDPGEGVALAENHFIAVYNT